jgi:hypothetical protein
MEIEAMDTLLEMTGLAKIKTLFLEIYEDHFVTQQRLKYGTLSLCHTLLRRCFMLTAAQVWF